jgi:class 3 adenylate cyclase
MAEGNMPQNTRAELTYLLQERNQYPERAAEIDRKIHATFDQECAMLVLDMSGFSRLTLRYGIIHFLAMIYRMSEIAIPLVQHNGGNLIKQEADNLFAIFPDVAPALQTALDIFTAFAVVNRELPDEQDLHAGIGIGYGTTLVVDGNDLYGCEMNLACKLGEDLARRGEVLLTEAAFHRLSPDVYAWERLDLSSDSLELIAYKFLAGKMPSSNQQRLA